MALPPGLAENRLSSLVAGVRRKVDQQFAQGHNVIRFHRSFLRKQAVLGDIHYSLSVGLKGDAPG